MDGWIKKVLQDPNNNANKSGRLTIQSEYFIHIIVIKNMFSKKVFKIFTVVCLLSLLSVWYINSINQKSYKFNTIKHQTQTQHNLTQNASSNECYNANITKYKVTIDGETYPKSLIKIRSPSIDLECLRKSEKKKTILIWNSWYDGMVDDSNLAECPLKCEVTRDKAKAPEADFVLFVAMDRGAQPPDRTEYTRPEFQRWIFTIFESPMHSVDFSKYNGYFNLTASYKWDSEYPGLYESTSSTHFYLKGFIKMCF